MTSEKIARENERAEELNAQKRTLLVQRRMMRSESSIARQKVTSKIEKMKSSSSFDVDESVRRYIQNPELNELLERCLEIRKDYGGDPSTVSMETMRTVLGQMEEEGAAV